MNGEKTKSNNKKTAQDNTEEIGEAFPCRTVMEGALFVFRYRTETVRTERNKTKFSDMFKCAVVTKYNV